MGHSFYSKNLFLEFDLKSEKILKQIHDLVAIELQCVECLNLTPILEVVLKGAELQRFCGLFLDINLAKEGSEAKTNEMINL